MAGDVNDDDTRHTDDSEDALGAIDVELWARPWRCALRAPVRIGDTVLSHREGVIIAARVGEAVGLGDACPLPGLSADSLADVEVGLEALEAGVPVDDEGLSAALRWAVESSRRELSNLIKGAPAAATVASALLVTSLDDPQLAQGARPGVDVVKLKVGRGDLAAERAAIVALRDAGLRLRLDANRGLHIEDAIVLAEAAGDALEFFEEPTGTRALHHAKHNMPIALDETIDTVTSMTKTAWTAKVLRALPRAAAWVLKPTVLGHKTQTALDVAAELGVAVIISSAYESRVGRRALALCAASVSDVPHGFGTGVAFADDVFDSVIADDDLVEEGPGWIKVKASPPWSTLLAAGNWRRLR